MTIIRQGHSGLHWCSTHRLCMQMPNYYKVVLLRASHHVARRCQGKSAKERSQNASVCFIPCAGSLSTGNSDMRPPRATTFWPVPYVHLTSQCLPPPSREGHTELETLPDDEKVIAQVKLFLNSQNEEIYSDGLWQLV